MLYTPNAEARLVTVAKNYRHAPAVVWETFRVVAHATGVSFPLVMGLGGGDGLTDDERVAEEFWGRDDAERLELAKRAASHYPKHHAVTDLVPWIAWSLNTVLKLEEKEQWNKLEAFLGSDVFEQASDAAEDEENPAAFMYFAELLWQRIPMLTLWAEQTGENLRERTWADVASASEGFEAEATNIAQEVVMSFDDGWTVQRLTDEAAIFAEGTSMGNCLQEDQLGPSYCNKVTEGTTEIYSLRSPQGKPHATLEWDVEHGRWNQVLGRNNDLVVERYRPYLRTFIASLPGAKLGIALLEVLGDFWRVANAEGIDLSKTGLEGLDFRQGKLSRSDFSGSDLAGADFEDAILEKANLSGADLAGVDMQDAVLLGTNLSGAILHNAKLINAKAAGADFTGAILHGADMTGAELQGAVLRGADLTDAYLKGAKLSGADLFGAKWTDASLVGSELRGMVFAGSDMKGANMHRAVLSRANLSKADLTLANLSRADLDGADLSGASLIDADLSGASLIDADLSGAQLMGAVLYGAELRGADLRRANLRGAQVRYWELEVARLTGAVMPNGSTYDEYHDHDDEDEDEDED